VNAKVMASRWSSQITSGNLLYAPTNIISEPIVSITGSYLQLSLRSWRLSPFWPSSVLPR